jgi:hypothetical protein
LGVLFKSFKFNFGEGFAGAGAAAAAAAGARRKRGVTRLFVEVALINNNPNCRGIFLFLYYNKI